MKSELKVTLLYILIGILWILISDEVILMFIEQNDLKKITNFQNIKGTFYILSTGIMLFLILRKHNKSIELKIKELKNKTSALETTNRELENFIYLASHDLQEPVRIIAIFLSQIEKKYNNSLDDKGKKYINFVVVAANKMRQTLIDFITYTKINKEVFLEEVDTNEIVETIKFQLLQKFDNSNVIINFSKLPTLVTDKELLKIIFKNILENAIKFKKEKTTAHIKIEVIKNNNYWIFKVIDNGIGIEKEYISKIFMPFQRLNTISNNQSSSIGLPVVHKIIKNLGGDIWVESEVNKGSQFFFSIPKIKK